MARLLPVVAVMVLAAAAIVGANLASQGFLAARSGDVVVSPKGGAAGSLLAVLNVEGASKTPVAMDETRVADVLSAGMGLEALTQRAGKDVVGGVEEAVARVAASGSRKAAPAGLVYAFAETPASAMADVPHVGAMLGDSTTQTFATTPASAPLDCGVADLTTALTGRVPAEHGIVARQWVAGGEVVSAFDGSAPVDALPRRASVADTLFQTYGGASLALAVSADEASVRAAAVDPRLSSFSGAVYVNLAGVVTAEVDPARFGDNFGAKVEAAGRAAVAGLVKAGTFDAKRPEDGAFLTELALVAGLPLAVAEAAPEVAADGALDMITSVFSSLGPLTARYGSDSDKVAAALAAVDTVVATSAAAWEAVYAGAGVPDVALLFLGSCPAPAASDLAAIRGAMGGHLSYELLPHMYVKPSTSTGDFAAVCGALAGLDLATVDVTCLLPTDATGSSVATGSELLTALSRTAGLLGNDTPSGNGSGGNGTIYDTSEVAIFQAWLWVGIFLIIIFFWVSCCLCYMSIPEDSLLYRQSMGKDNKKAE